MKLYVNADVIVEHDDGSRINFGDAIYHSDININRAELYMIAQEALDACQSIVDASEGGADLYDSTDLCKAVIQKWNKAECEDE